MTVHFPDLSDKSTYTTYYTPNGSYFLPAEAQQQLFFYYYVQ